MWGFAQLYLSEFWSCSELCPHWSVSTSPWRIVSCYRRWWSPDSGFSRLWWSSDSFYSITMRMTFGAQSKTSQQLLDTPSWILIQTLCSPKDAITLATHWLFCGVTMRTFYYINYFFYLKTSIPVFSFPNTSTLTHWTKTPTWVVVYDAEASSLRGCNIQRCGLLRRSGPWQLSAPNLILCCKCSSCFCAALTSCKFVHKIWGLES